MLVFILETYLFTSFLTAWLISYGLQDEEYGELLGEAIGLTDDRFYDTTRIMLTAPFIVWGRL